MSTSILPLKNGSIVTYRNSINYGDSDKDSDNDRKRDSYDVNEGNSTKMSRTQDEPSTLVNHVTITS